MPHYYLMDIDLSIDKIRFSGRPLVFLSSGAINAEWCVMCAQSGLTLWDLTDCSLPGSSVHGISQVRILEWGLELPFPTPGIFLTQGSNPHLQCLLRWQADSLPLGSQYYGYWRHKFSNFPGGSDGKESAHNAGDLGSIPGSGWSPGVGNSNPLQYSCPEIPWTEQLTLGLRACKLLHYD